MRDAGVVGAGDCDEPGGILRMKFMGALGFASARENKPAADVAEGGNGCCGYTFVRTVVAGRGGTYACA